MINPNQYYIRNSRTQNNIKRDKLYFGETIAHISIDDIQSAIKENIINYSKWINEYVNVINRFLLPEVKLDINNMIFDIRRKYGENANFEDDGNTHCEGFNYDILWAFPIGNSNNESNQWYIRQEYAEKSLYFTYEDSERLFDNKVKGSRFFSIYLAGVKLPREEQHITRIDYNNGNYVLNSVLNKGNIVNIVMKIQDLERKIKLINKLESIELFKLNS